MATADSMYAVPTSRPRPSASSTDGFFVGIWMPIRFSTATLPPPFWGWAGAGVGAGAGASS